MAQVVVVTSGKGGVGKTTSSAAIATGLAQRGKKTVVIDFDVGLRNLDLIMGVERRVVFDIVNVISGEARLNQALIRDKRVDTLSILPADDHRRVVEGFRLHPVRQPRRDREGGAARAVFRRPGDRGDQPGSVVGA